jgi:hypothetical protein
VIYFAQLPTGAIKIGTTEDLRQRMNVHAFHYGYRLEVLATMPGGPKEASAIHRQFGHLRIGRTEEFRAEPDLLEFIKFRRDGNPPL